MPKEKTPEMTPRQRQKVFERIMGELVATWDVDPAEADKAIERLRKATARRIH